MDSLTVLEHNIQELLRLYEEQQCRISELQQENDRQRNEIIRTHAELAEAETRYKRLHTAYSLIADDMSNEERMKARQRITNIIAQVDRAIQILKQ